MAELIKNYGILYQQQVFPCQTAEKYFTLKCNFYYLNLSDVASEAID
jgi:hypothetical protein